MDRRDFIIGTLSTTAVILFVGLLLVQSRPAKVQADGMSIQGGGYLVTVAAGHGRDEELVHVLHMGTERMVTYRFDSDRAAIDLVQGIDLAQVREAADEEAAKRFLNNVPRP
jgi:hypothetical protein